MKNHLFFNDSFGYFGYSGYYGYLNNIISVAWILAANIWNDTGVWDDSDTWND